MCGRYTLTTPIEALRSIFEAEGGFNLMPRYNIAPTQEVVAVRRGPSGRRDLGLLRWGLVPSWAKDPAIGSRMINARSETVTEKPSFRRAFAQRRCLLPADGFYEWKSGPGGKQPYFLHDEDRKVMAFAGLWEAWPGMDPQNPLETCTILTTSAQPNIAEIHHRMPVILPRDAYSDWLDPQATENRLLELLRPSTQAHLTAHRISTRVNKVSNDDPSVIEPEKAGLELEEDDKAQKRVAAKKPENDRGQGELF